MSSSAHSQTAFLPPLVAPLSRTPRSCRQLRTTSHVSMVASRRVRPSRTISQSPAPSQKVKVNIYAPAPNKRRISACNLINAPLPIVWELLSDYGRLADHIPNVVLSEVRPHPTGGIRLEQCGAQSILGFQFRASLVMDMMEVNPTSDDWRAIDFDLVSSPDFTLFEGTWKMQEIDGKTALYYSVTIQPKGLVPVRALEWRISEDIPVNMDAVRVECERRRRVNVAASRRNQIANDQ